MVMVKKFFCWTRTTGFRRAEPRQRRGHASAGSTLARAQRVACKPGLGGAYLLSTLTSKR